MEKLYFESPYIVDGHKKLYGEVSIFNLARAFTDEKAAGPIFQELISLKNGSKTEILCLASTDLIDEMSILMQKPLISQLFYEYYKNAKRT